MTEIALLIVIALLLGYVAWLTYEFKLERKQLLNAVLAKTPEQLRDLDIADKLQVKTDVPTPAQSDLVPLDQLDEEGFDQHIKESLENG